MSDDTRQARIEQTARVIYGANPQIAEWEESTQYGAISRESVVKWESLDEYLDQVKVDVGEYAAVYRTADLLNAARAVIDAADAVGRERVSEAGIDAAARVLADIDRLGYWDIAKEEYRNAYRRDAARVLDAYLTAALPERHDAPGVTVALSDITAERARQNAKWGQQRHTWGDWMAILGEEYGEACKEAVECTFGKGEFPLLRTELIHLAAVAVQIVEHLDELTGQPDAGRDPDAGGDAK